MFFSKNKNEDDPAPEAAEETVPVPEPAELKTLLREVYDPEIGVNIVDLGLIYEVKADEEGHVHVLMTLTTPGCPYGPQLLAEVNYILRNARGVKDVEVEVTWDPPWSMDMVSEEIRLDMGLDW